jgi:hypothetical protein
LSLELTSLFQSSSLSLSKHRYQTCSRSFEWFNSFVQSISSMWASMVTLYLLLTQQSGDSLCLITKDSQTQVTSRMPLHSLWTEMLLTVRTFQTRVQEHSTTFFWWIQTTSKRITHLEKGHPISWRGNELCSKILYCAI